MTRILAIDPGSSQSAWIMLNGERVESFAIDPNETLLDAFRNGKAFALNADTVVIEWTAPRGMPASADLFETLWWAGRFAEANRDFPVDRVKRLDVKRHVCGTTAAKDANVRAALIDRFGGPDSIRKGGVLYKVGKDVWAALAVAVTYADQLAGVA